MWAKAVNTAHHFWYRMTIKGEPQNLTLHEELVGKRPVLSHHRVFGCKAHVNVSSKHQDGRLAMQAEESILVG